MGKIWTDFYIKSKYTFYMPRFFPPKIVFYEKMSKNMVDPEAKNDVTIWRILVTYRISNATRAHAHANAHAPRHSHSCTHRQIYNIYCFSTARVVTRTHLWVALYVHCLSCWVFAATIVIVFSRQQWTNEGATALH
jgi:hypothetical protein